MKDDLENWYLKGITFFRAQRFDEAAACFTKALAIDATHETSWLWMGYVFLAIGKWKEGAFCFRKVLHLNPGNTEARKSLSLLSRELVKRQAHEEQSSETDQGDWKKGDVIANTYDVKGLLGEGGFGKVFKVHHRNWNIDLAVKSPHAEIMNDEDEVRRYVREAETWVKLGIHPNITTCFFVRELGGVHRIFVECVEGGSLSDWMRAGRVRPGDMKGILDLMIQFCRGMEHSHGMGLVHRDIKPDNCLMTPEGGLRITDFGIAKVGGMDDVTRAASPVSQKAMEESLTIGGIGTPGYTSPEQWLSAKDVTRAADFWSFGAMFYQLVTGENPFIIYRGEELEAYCERLYSLGWNYRKLSRRAGNLPRTLIGLFDGCLHPDPEQRISAVRDFGNLASRLESQYHQLAGVKYPRPRVEMKDILSGSLNNQALSLLELGKTEEAEELWKQALEADPLHPEATYNYGLIKWRSARINDDHLLGKLEDILKTRAGDSRIKHLIGQVHMERGDREQALKFLEEAAKKTPRDEGIQRALERTKNKNKGWRGIIKTFEEELSPWGFQGLAITPNNRFVISAGDTLMIWDIQTGKVIHDFPEEGSLNFVTLVPGGKSFLSGDKEFKLWSLENGKPIVSFEGHTDTVSSVAVSSDGGVALSGSRDETVRLWDLRTGECLHIFEGHNREVEAVAITPDDRFALSASADATIRIWDLQARKCVDVLEAPTSVMSMALSSDGKLLLTGNFDYSIDLWDFQTGDYLRTFEGHRGHLRPLVFCHHGQCFLSGAGDDTIKLWEVGTGRCIHTFFANDSLFSMAVISQGNFALSGGSGIIKLWCLGEREQLEAQFVISKPRFVEEEIQNRKKLMDYLSKAESALQHGDYPGGYALAMKARSIPGYNLNEKVLDLCEKCAMKARRITLRKAWLRKTFQAHSGEILFLVFGPREGLALSGGRDETIKLWDMTSGECLRTIQGRGNGVFFLALSPDGHRILSGSYSDTLRLWDIKSGECLHTFQGHKESVSSVATTPNGKFCLSGGLDWDIRLWDLDNGACLHTFKGHTEAVGPLAVSPDGRFFFSGSDDGTIRKWDLGTRKSLEILDKQRYDECIQALEISPNGRFLASGGNQLIFWDTHSCECLYCSDDEEGILDEFGEFVDFVHFFPGGDVLLEGGSGNDLRVIDFHTRKCLWRFERTGKGGISSVALSPTGRFLLLGNSDGDIHLWELDWEYEFPEPLGWDEGARPYLEFFLARQEGRPWEEEDFQDLLSTLDHQGYGWLKEEGVRRELGRMAKKEWGVSLIDGPSQASETMEDNRFDRKVDHYSVDEELTEEERLKAKRDELNSRIRELVKQRNALNEEAKTFLKKGKELKKKRDYYNEDVKEVKKKRDNIKARQDNMKISLSRMEQNPRVSPEEMAFLKEEIARTREYMKEEHDRVVDFADIAKKSHERMIQCHDEAAKLMERADRKQKEILELKEEADRYHQQLIDLIRTR